MYCTVGIYSTHEGLSYFSILFLIGLETEHGTLHTKVSVPYFEMFKIQML
jgi:hypothetical protein